ncbi:MAG: LLM class flavin-dependent oxidoreductase [Acidimicrobiia bacterium]|nr:LLM class flavin-dependent oxidoreductase [Acidimicrobiia bacterium]
MDLGVCARDLPAPELCRLAQYAESLGYTDLFVPDIRGADPDPDGPPLGGRDAFVSLGSVFAATTTIYGAVGVAAVIFHQPTALAVAASTLNEVSDGRFTLGVGISHAEAAERAGVAFPASPMAEMGRWVSELATRSHYGMAFGGDWPILVGALGPKMVALGAAHADGVVLNWLSVDEAARTVTAAKEAAAETSRNGRTVLYLRVMPGDLARTDAVNYDAMANYHQHFVNQGLHTPDDIVAATCLPASDLGEARDRLAAYAETGLDLVCLYPHGWDEAERNRILAGLAPG